MDRAVIDAAKAKYPDAELIKLDARLKSGERIEVIAKVPNWGEATMYREELAKPTSKGSATPHFVQTCIVWPEQAGVRELLEKRPFLIESWATILQEKAGITEEVTASDLSESSR